eukprot:jgi/Mesvir1/19798/Mv13090-RA.1
MNNMRILSNRKKHDIRRFQGQEEVDVDNLPSNDVPRQGLKRLVRISDQPTFVPTKRVVDNPTDTKKVEAVSTPQPPTTNMSTAPSTGAGNTGATVVPSDWPVSATLDGTQSYIRDYFEGNKAAKPPRTQSLLNRGCNMNPTDPENRYMALQQAVVNTHLRALATRPTNQRGFLAWHSTGSGKTCTAMAAIDAFWDTNKPILLVTSLENARGKLPEYVHCARLFPRFRNDTQAKILEKLRKRIFQHDLITFPRLAHMLGLEGIHANKDSNKNLLSNAVLVMDEVHNLYRPSIPSLLKEHQALLRFLLNNARTETQNLFMVILTATLGEDEKEILNLLNMIRKKDAPLLTTESPPSAFNDLVSFVDYAGDTSTYPKIVKDIDHVVRMSPEQAMLVRNRLMASSKSKRNDPTHPMYLSEARRAANTVPFKGVDKSQLLSELPRLSPKFKRLTDIVTTTPNEKHYVYTFFNVGGLKELSRVFEALGYSRLGNSRPEKPGKRYALLGVEDDEPALKLQHVRDVFNEKNNAKGEYLHVILARRKFNEGLDLKGVRHVHIVEPLLSKNAEKQTIARAVRYCSHSFLSKEAWTVTVHRYLSVGDETSKLNALTTEQIEKTKSVIVKRVKEMLGSSKDDTDSRILMLVANNALDLLDSLVPSVDRRIAKEAADRAKNESMEKLLTSLRSAAVDCRLFASMHNSAPFREASGRSEISCG